MRYTRLDTLQSIDLSDPLISRHLLWGIPFSSHLIKASALYREQSPSRVPYLRLNPGSKWAVRLIPEIAFDTHAAHLAFLSTRDGWSCFYCGKDLDEHTATIEHIVSVAHGGPTHGDNLCLTCGPCNAAAGALPAVQKMKLAVSARVGTIALKIFNDQPKRRRERKSK